MIPSRRMSGAALAVLLTAFLLSACAVQRQPSEPGHLAPIISPTTTPAPPSFGGEGSYVVQRGDSLSGVARKFGVPARAVIDANGLKPPFTLQIGQRLTLPQQKTHTVEPGETLFGISKRYGVDSSVLVQLNKLEPPYAIRSGMVLTLPAPPVTETASVMPSGTPQRSGSVDVASLPSPSISAAPLPSAPLPSAPLPAPLPPPPPPPAQSLVPPPPPPPPPAPQIQEASPPPQLSAPVPTPAEAPPAPPAQQPPAPTAAAPAPAPAAPPAAPAAGAPSEPQRVAVAPPRPPPPRAGKTFQWPVKGRVVATFGPQGRGLHNNGLNIAAPRGTPIRAAENGRVDYVGDEIKSLGNLLLISHMGGYITAYAHADAILVKKGDEVRRGQVIARVGESGDVTEPQLHFEIRQNSQAIDPQPLMGAPGAS